MHEAAANVRPQPVEPSRWDVALHAVPDLAPTAPALDLPPYDLAAALELERELGVSHVLAQVLVRRGLSDVHAARTFLEPSAAHDPAVFARYVDEVIKTARRNMATGQTD